MSEPLLEKFLEAQATVGRWGESTFPEATGESILEHMGEEYIELAAATCDGIGEVSEEAADMLIMLMHLAHLHGFNLLDEALAKWREIKDAEWHDDGRGYAKRVKP